MVAASPSPRCTFSAAAVTVVPADDAAVVAAVDGTAALCNRVVVAVRHGHTAHGGRLCKPRNLSYRYYDYIIIIKIRSYRYACVYPVAIRCCHHPRVLPRARSARRERPLRPLAACIISPYARTWRRRTGSLVAGPLCKRIAANR